MPPGTAGQTLLSGYPNQLCWPRLILVTYSFNRSGTQILSTFYVPGIALGIGDTAVSKRQKNPAHPAWSCQPSGGAENWEVHY